MKIFNLGKIYINMEHGESYIDIYNRNKNKWNSQSKISGETGEEWALQHLLCSKCICYLEKCKPGTSEKDFWCPICGEPFQVKNSKSNKKGRIQSSVMGANYQTTVNSIECGNQSNYIFLGRYNNKILSVELATKENISTDCIFKCPERKTHNNRSIFGCNILRDKISNKLYCWLGEDDENKN